MSMQNKLRTVCHYFDVIMVDAREIVALIVYCPFIVFIVIKCRDLWQKVCFFFAKFFRLWGKRHKLRGVTTALVWH